jgi:hypothetical protein
MSKYSLFFQKVFIENKLSKNVFILLLFLHFALNLSAQRIIYEYRYAPTLGRHLRDGVNAWSKGLASHASLSAEVDKRRSEFFTALKSSSPNLSEKEKIYFETLMGKDIMILFDYKNTKMRFGDKTPINFFETFFGKIDGGIHSLAEDHFEEFADTYIFHEKKLLNGNILNFNADLFLEAFNKALPEYKSYCIVRDWIEFEEQNVQIGSNDDRNKHFIIGTTVIYCKRPLSLEEGEEYYNQLSKALGKNNMNRIYDLFRKAFNINAGFKLNLNKLSQSEINEIFNTLNATLTKNTIYTHYSGSFDQDCSPMSHKFFHDLFRYNLELSEERLVFNVVKNYTHCKRDLHCAYQLYKNLEDVFGKTAVDSVLNKIYKSKKVFDKDGDYIWSYRLEQPVKIRGKNVFALQTAFLGSLFEKHPEKFASFLLRYSKNEKIKSISDLKSHGEDQFIKGIDKGLFDYLEHPMSNFSGILESIYTEIHIKRFDYSILEKLPGAYTGDPDYFYKKSSINSDTFQIYTILSSHNPQDNYKFINSIGRGICLMVERSKGKLPENIKVNLTVNDRIDHSFSFGNNSDYRTLTYNENGKISNIDVSSILSKYSHCCLYEQYFREIELKEQENKDLNKSIEYERKKNTYFFQKDIKAKINVLNNWYNQIEKDKGKRSSNWARTRAEEILFLNDFFEPIFGTTFKSMDHANRKIFLADLELIYNTKSYSKSLNSNILSLLKKFIHASENQHKSMSNLYFNENEKLRNQFILKKSKLEEVVKLNKKTEEASRIINDSVLYYENLVHPSELENLKELKAKARKIYGY